jgi:hypothetical protein
MIISFKNTGSSAITHTFDAAVGGYLFGSDITSSTPISTSHWNHMGFMYNASASVWHVVSEIRGF